MAHALEFSFDEYQVDPQGHTVTFSYSIQLKDEPTIQLTESLQFPVTIDQSSATVKRILQALHIGLGISYYKIFIPPAIKVPYHLSEEAARFWNTVYKQGLGEFLYINSISSDRLAHFSGSGHSEHVEQAATQHSALLGVGGGKDSIVGFELLKKLNVPTEGFILGTGTHTGQAQAVADIMQIPTLQIQRTLDPQIKSLNKRQDTYNGHVPISMIFALCGVMLAHASKHSYVVVANEASASLPQVTWNGNPINHQWSKSLDFERAFQSYVKNELCKGITYFSAVRPLTSIAIAKLFANSPAYFETFTSDNGVFKIDPFSRPNGRWSIDSPKSLSSFILLAPWLDDEQLVKIFGANLMYKSELMPLFKRLIGLEGHPPLDCVGTVEELRLCLSLLAQQGRYELSELMILAQEFVAIKQNSDEALKQALHLSNEHCLPPEIQSQYFALLQQELST